MITPQELAAAYARNVHLLEQQTAGLSHADSVLQPPFRGNCLNWVLGHIIENRNTVLGLLGQPAIITPGQAGRYGYGSEPVWADSDDLIRLEEQLALLKKSQATIDAVLPAMSEEELAVQVDSFMGPQTLGFMLFFRYYHETYHAGQTELLRQLAGVDDKVV